MASHFVRTLHSAFRSSWIEVEVELASSRFNCFGFWFLVFFFLLLIFAFCSPFNVGRLIHKCAVWSVKYRTIHTGTSSHSNPHPSPSFLTLAKSFIDTYIGYVSLFTCTSTTESGFAPSSDSVNVVVMHACVRASSWVLTGVVPKFHPVRLEIWRETRMGFSMPVPCCYYCWRHRPVPAWKSDSPHVQSTSIVRTRWFFLFLALIWPIKTTVSVGLGLGLVRTKLAISSLHTPRKQMQCLLIGIMRWLKWMKYEGGGGRAWITTFNWRGKRFFYSFTCLITSSFFFLECFRDSIISSLWNFVIFFHSLDGS